MLSMPKYPTLLLVGGLYGENTPPTDLADRIAESNPKYVVKLLHQRIIPKLALADKEMLDGLERVGFKHTAGPDGSGFIMSELRGGVSNVCWTFSQSVAPES